MAAKKNDPRREARIAKNNRNLNSALTLFTAGFIAEFYLLLINQYFVKGSVDQVVAIAGYLEVMAIVGAAAFGAGVVLTAMRRKWTRFAAAGNENTVSRVINELFRKGVEVIYDRADMLHVSGHACQEELKIIHALTKPKYFIPVHGEQRMLQIHKNLAMSMGMDRKNIAICENGDAVEITARTMKLVPGMAPAGEIFVDGSGVGDVGAVVLRDRKHLAEDGMVVVVLPISAHDGYMLAEPEIITRGFIYVKESEELMNELKTVVMSAAEGVLGRRSRDIGELKGAIKSGVSNYLFKTTKRSPMVIPVITKL